MSGTPPGQGFSISRSDRPPAGFTILELCLTVGLLVVVGMIAIARLQDLRRDHARNPVECQENLRFIGMALVDFATEHEGHLPWEVSARGGGSLEAIPTGQAAPHFRALTNTIRNTRTLLCPMDPVRFRGARLENIDDSAISYFVNISARQNSKTTILAGDRTLSPGEDTTTGEISVGTKSTLRWTRPAPDQTGHVEIGGGDATGNLLFGNNTLMETTSFQLERIVRSFGTNAQRFVLP